MFSDENAYERKTIPKAWSDEQKAQLVRMRVVERRDWSEIAKAFGRSEAACKSKFKYEQVEQDRTRVTRDRPAEPVPDSVWAERAKRVADLTQRTLTASIFGDPVFSQSALAKKNGGVMA